MPNKIEHLAAERDALLAQLQSLDRLRRGSLSRQVYSKKQAGQPHTQGPYFVLQGFHKGIKFSQRVSAAEAEQVQQQVNNFKRFQDLADRCVTVTDQITQLAEAKPDGKKLQPAEVQAGRFQETEAFLRLVREDFARQGVGNLEAVELGLREALLKDGRRLLEELLSQADQSLADNTSRPGEKCHPGRGRQAQTIFGSIGLRRRYFYDPAKQKGRAPLDEALGLVNGFSPALVRLSARAAARQGYEAASQDLHALAGIEIEGRQIQRLVNRVAPQMAAQLEQGQNTESEAIPVMYVEVDGTGVPMVAAELAGRKGRQPEGTAKTREVKLGAVFTQTRCDEAGRAERDFASTTYVGSFEPAEPFGLRVRAEVRRRGLAQARQVVFIGDGAAWIWELCRLNFPGAVEILDLYHALEHLHQLCDDLYPGQKYWAKKMKFTWENLLKNDQVAVVIAGARRRLQQLSPEPENPLKNQIAYFEHHQHRMRYKTYRQAGLFCGSGVVEAGCRAVVGQRLKNSGMFWTEAGGKSVLDLRCALQSNRWDECWNRLHESNRLKIRAAA